MRAFLLIAALAACRGPEPRFAGGILAPLDTDNGRLLVTAVIDGKPCRLVLDTGASITSISTDAARDLGIAIESPTQINDSIPAQLGVLKSLSIGLADHFNLEVAIVDLPNARDSAVNFQGILGLDVLSRHDVVLDLGRHQLALYPSGAVAKSSMSTMERIEIDYGSHGLITLEVKFGNHPPIPAILDLGAPTSVVNSAAAAVLDAQRPAFQPHALNIGGVEVSPKYILVSDLPVFGRFGLADRPAMLLGSDVFKNRALVIAYHDRVAFVSR